jgi:hypothetical protein
VIMQRVAVQLQRQGVAVHALITNAHPTSALGRAQCYLCRKTPGCARMTSPVTCKHPAVAVEQLEVSWQWVRVLFGTFSSPDPHSRRDCKNTTGLLTDVNSPQKEPATVLLQNGIKKSRECIWPGHAVESLRLEARCRCTCCDHVAIRNDASS